MKKIAFNPRWREELVAASDDGVLIFELTMGSYHVYFPTRERWLIQVPAWAENQWDEYKSACEAWCQRERIPFTLADNALVYEDAKQKGDAR